jgi:hypothetical protein
VLIFEKVFGKAGLSPTVLETAGTAGGSLGGEIFWLHQRLQSKEILDDFPWPSGGSREDATV